MAAVGSTLVNCGGGRLYGSGFGCLVVREEKSRRRRWLFNKENGRIGEKREDNVGRERDSENQ